MKIAAAIAGVLLGLLFIVSSVLVLFNLIKDMPPPASPEAGQLMVVFGTTGYLTFVKVCELVGGVLVLLPRTRALGLLLLGPIITNILVFHQFVAKDGLVILNPTLVVMSALALFLVWADRAKWKALVS